MDIATILNTLKAKVNSLAARDIGDGIATVFLTIEVKNREELSDVVSRLRSVSGVTDIKRV